MKTFKTAAWLAITVLALRTAHAELPDRGFGIGIMVGEPTGISIKKWVGNTRAFDAGIAWSFTENDSLHFHADYLFHKFDLRTNPEIPPNHLPFYYGIGARVKLQEENNGNGRNDSDDIVGIRFPLGFSYLFVSTPIDAFIELVPMLDVAPDSEFDLGLALGARYYF